MCKASASVLVVVVPLLALLCTTVMGMCQMTLLLLRLSNARGSDTQTFTAATLKTVICFVLCAACVGDSPSPRCMGIQPFLYLIVIHRNKGVEVPL